MQMGPSLEEHLNWREDSLGLGSPVIGVVKDPIICHWREYRTHVLIHE